MTKKKMVEPPVDPMETRRVCFGRHCGAMTRVGTILCPACNTPTGRERVRGIVYSMAADLEAHKEIVLCHSAVHKRMVFLEESLAKAEQLLSVNSHKLAHKSLKEALLRD